MFNKLTAQTWPVMFRAVQIKLTYVSFRAHVKLASRTVSYHCHV